MTESLQLVPVTKSNAVDTTEFISFPTVLEIYARDRFEQYMRDGLQFLVNHLAERHPRHFARIAANFDEWYLAFDTIIQYICLKSHNATLSECFYKIRRVQTVGGQGLSMRQIILSLLTTSVAPYLYKRIRQWEAELANPNFGHPAYSQNSMMQQILSSMFPHFKCHWPTVARQAWASCDSLWGLANTVQRIRYASGRTTSLDLLLPLLGINLVHSDPIRDNFVTYGTLAIEQCLTFGSIGLRLADAWYNRNSAPTAPPPPPPPAIQLPIESLEICELCAQKYNNPAVLSVSGYVFCHDCIHKFVEQHEKCPVTGIRARTDLIVTIKQN